MLPRAPSDPRRRRYGANQISRRARRREDGIDFAGWHRDTGAMGVRTRGLDIKAGAAKLKADKAACRDAELMRRATARFRLRQACLDPIKRPRRRLRMATLR